MGEQQPHDSPPPRGDFPLLRGLVGDVDRFASEFWGRRPIRRSLTGGVPELSIADVEAMLDRSLRAPSIRLVQDGRPLPAREWTTRLRLGGVDLDDVADGHKVAAAFGRGATIVLQGLHRTWAPLVSYGRELEAEIDHPVQVNAYLTPPASRGLARHTDAHDVFVVQMAGSKRWWIDGLGDTELRRTDVLYVPAGTGHRAESGEDASLHLTIGVLRRTTRHVIERALRNASDLDEPLPLGFAHDPGALTDVVRRRLAGVANELDRPALVAAVVQDIVERARSWPTAAGRLVAVDDARSVGSDSRLRWRPENQVSVDGDGVLIRDERRWVRVPAVATAAVRALRDQGIGCVRDLPGLDPAARLVLARRLVRERCVDLEHAVPEWDEPRR